MCDWNRKQWKSGVMIITIIIIIMIIIIIIIRIIVITINDNRWWLKVIRTKKEESLQNS